MAHGIRQERQLLSADEFALVEKTHHPVLASMSDKDLADLQKLVRERRDRAREIAARQRRELRGKSAPKGARPARDDTGSRGKSALLAAAVQRINKEASRREARASRQNLVGNAMRALEMRRAGEAKTARRPANRTAHDGMQTKAPPPGRRPSNPAKLGAVSQHTKNMQAKRDAK